MVPVGAGPATELGPQLITRTRVWSFKSLASTKNAAGNTGTVVKGTGGGKANEMSFFPL